MTTINKKTTTIPNTLTIFINTRVRNHRNFKYVPSMTVPAEKSTVVCFEPLVQINKNSINQIPPGYPKEELYTQFFRRNEFNSLLSRSLNTFPMRAADLLSAKYQGIIDHNIRLVLDTLFKQGTPFYIEKERFTVNSYEWFNGDWQIGTKIFEQSLYSKVGYSPSLPYYGNSMLTIPGSSALIGSTPGTVITSAQYMSPVNAQIGLNELNEIPEDATKGSVNPVSSKLQKAVLLNTGISTITAATTTPTSPLTLPGLAVPIPTPALKNPPIIGPPAPAYLNPDAQKAVGVVQARMEDILKTAPSSTNNRKVIDPLDRLHLNFMNAYNEGVRRDLISPPKAKQLEAYLDEISSWQIQPNNGGGDCLFYSIMDILNSAQNTTDRGAPILVPHGPNGTGGAMTPMNPNPYVDARGLYSVRSLRQALLDILDNFPNGPNIVRDYIATGTNQYASGQDQVRYRFLMNERRDAPLREDEIKRIMRIPADATLRDPVIDGPELVGQNRYYWGDELAVQFLEVVFQVKFIIINTEERAHALPERTNHVRFTDPATKETKVGVVVNQPTTMNPDIEVELEDYTHVNIDQKDIDTTFIDDNYNVYCVNTLDGADFSRVTNFAFILYNPNGPHFESLYVEKRGKKQYIITSVDLLPSYIKYLIFLYCYRFIEDASKPISPYGQINGFSSIFALLIKIINEKIGNATLSEEDRAKARQINPQRKLHFGGAGPPPAQATALPPTSTSNSLSTISNPNPVQVASTAPVQAIPIAPTLTPLQQSQVTGAKQSPQLFNVTGKYLQETPQFAAYDARIGYYVIIDLELYPGDSISMGRGLVIGCDNKQEKIWGAMADIFGIPYQAKEITVPAKPIVPSGPGAGIMTSSTKEQPLQPKQVELLPVRVGGRNTRKMKSRIQKRRKTKNNRK